MQTEQHNREVTPWLQESGLTKQSQANLAASIINRVMDGELNALDAKVMLKSAEAVIKRAMDGIDYEARKEAEKYGMKSMNYRDVKVELAQTGTSYNYCMCNDDELLRLEAELAELKQRITERQKFLQSIKGEMTIVDEATGEVRKLYPPIKSSNDGLKITFM